MSEPARQAPTSEPATRAPTNPAPLRDWLAAMRNAAAESRVAELQADRLATSSNEPEMAEPRSTGWAPRLVTSAAKPVGATEDDISELMAENMVLKAKLQLESERRDELQAMVTQEIRELRAHITEELAKIEDLRAERDLWRARCEALASPLFQAQAR